MDRAAAHTAIDALLDHLDRVRGANEPEAQIAVEAQAHETWQRLAAGVAGPMVAQRLGAAWHGRHPDDPGVAQAAAAAETTGRMPFTAEAMAVPENATRARIMLMRFLLDHAELLPPGLSACAVKALYLLGEGEAVGITAPYYIPHAPTARGRRRIRDISHMTRVYYWAGYFNSSLPPSLPLPKQSFPPWMARTESGKFGRKCGHELRKPVTILSLLPSLRRIGSKGFLFTPDRPRLLRRRG